MMGRWGGPRPGLWNLAVQGFNSPTLHHLAQYSAYEIAPTMIMLRTMRKPPRPDPSATKPAPVSLSPLSFEDAVRALAATPPLTEKAKRQTKTRAPKRQTPRKQK